MKARIFILGLLFAVFCTASSSYADVPQMINYHGQLTTPEGDLIDTTVSMTFAVYADSVGGDPLWSETQESVKVEKGVFSVLLGSVNPIPSEAFESGLRYLGVKVGLDPEMTPRSQIASVGYAFRSQRADTAEYALGGAGKQGNGWVDDGTVVRLETATDRVGIGATDPDSKLEICSPDFHRVGLSLDGNTIKAILTCPGSGKTPLGADLNLKSAGWGDIVLDPGTFGWVRTGGNIQADSNLFFNSSHHSVMGINYPDETFDIRLRVTAGRDDTGDNLQGASIDLHGNDFAPFQKNGDLDLVAGAGTDGARGDITFWTGNPGTERMRITGDGNVGIGFGGGGANLNVEGSIQANGSIRSGNSLILDGPNDRLLTTSREMHFERDITSGSFKDVHFFMGTFFADTGSMGAMLEVGGNIQADSNFFFNSMHHSVMGINHMGSHFDRRLRITAGRDDTYNNDQGACVDLHGVNHRWNPGRLDLVAGSGSEITLWTGTGAQRRMVINNDGNIGIGAGNPQGALDVNSTTGAFIVPRMSTAQRNAIAPVNGMIIYNTTTNQFNFYENGAWVIK